MSRPGLPLALVLGAALGAAIAAACPASGAAQASPPDSAAVVPRGERWQILLDDGDYVYDVRPLRLGGDTLYVQLLDSATAPPRAIPLATIDELRRVGASVKMVGAGARGTFGGLAGADDAVFKLAMYDAAERRRIVAGILHAISRP
jgi:hypothetical protein